MAHDQKLLISMNFESMKFVTTSIIMILFMTSVIAQIGVDTEMPHHSAILDFGSKTRGF